MPICRHDAGGVRRRLKPPQQVAYRRKDLFCALRRRACASVAAPRDMPCAPARYFCRV